MNTFESLHGDQRVIVGTGRRELHIDRSFPVIVCLCGSTRFKDSFNKANLALTLAGYIVLSVGSFTHSDAELKLNDDKKVELDHLHKRKIDLADCVLVLNVGGYVGQSTKSEIDYAHNTGKPVLYAGSMVPGKLIDDYVGAVTRQFN